MEFVAIITSVSFFSGVVGFTTVFEEVAGLGLEGVAGLGFEGVAVAAGVCAALLTLFIMKIYCAFECLAFLLT